MGKAKGPDQTPHRQKVAIELGPSGDLPILFANQVVVNFLKHDFTVTVMASLPEPFIEAAKAPRTIQARTIGRYVFSAAAWVAATQSFVDQIEQLRAIGALSDETFRDANEMLGK